MPALLAGIFVSEALLVLIDRHQRKKTKQQERRENPVCGLFGLGRQQAE